MTNMSLATTRVGAVEAQKTIVMLHGIYGRGRNWQAIAKALVARRPDYACLLVDLPHHGDSGPGSHGATVAGLAGDVLDGIAVAGVVPDAVLGHSFGGKVALAMAAAMTDRDLQVWVIDSTPATREPAGTAWSMLGLVRGLPQRVASRDDVVTAITDGGWPLGVAQWMATNLVRDDEGFVWRLDFNVMETLLRDFFTSDLWSVVEDRSNHRTFHFIKASESSAMSDAAVQRAQALPQDRVTVHHLQGGHWIHAESPLAIVDLLATHLT